MQKSNVILTKKIILEQVTKITKELNEETSLGSVMGPMVASNQTGGFFIGPLSRISKDIINRRIYFPGGKDKKNTDGSAGKIVTPPQGYVREHLYTHEGELVTEQMIREWFGDTISNRAPAWNGGKIVKIEPKCLTFPYCSQGAVDKPLKLIGESAETTCPDAWEDVEALAKEANKTPETMAKIIREYYLNMML